MAKFDFDFPDLDLAAELALTDDIANKMLKAGAEIVAKKQREYARARLGKKGRGEGVTADSIAFNIDKGKRSATIYPRGTRPNGEKVKRNAEVAFINEYGAPDRGIPATHFISDAVEDSADEAADAMREIWNNQDG